MSEVRHMETHLPIFAFVRSSTIMIQNRKRVNLIFFFYTLYIKYHDIIESPLRLISSEYREMETFYNIV